MGLLHGVGRLPDGGVQIRLSSRERELLRSLPDQVRPLLTGDAEAPEIQARLFPRAYDDPEAEAEYQRLAAETISAERIAAIEAFAETLEGGETGWLTWQVQLSAEQADAWLSALNDTRLTLAMLVGIRSEEDWEQGPDESDPSSVALWYLGWLQEQLLGVLTGGLEDEGP